MRSYAIRRILLVIPTMLLLTLAVFFMVRLIPGDMVTMMVSAAAICPGEHVQADPGR